MLLIIDNYDSFAHNLARYFVQLGVAVQVVRNDRVDVADIRQLAPQAIVMSPGPCTPDEAGCCLDVAGAFADTLPMLGVCLGHQAIAQALGGRVVRAERPWHGRASPITHSGTGVFADVPNPLQVGRYHSLVVDPASLPDELEPTAWTDDGTLMAFAHRLHPVVGVQFHPESILTQYGYAMLANFLQLAGLDMEQNPVALAAREFRAPLTHQLLPDRPVTF